MPACAMIFCKRSMAPLSTSLGRLTPVPTLPATRVCTGQRMRRAVYRRLFEDESLSARRLKALAWISSGAHGRDEHYSPGKPAEKTLGGSPAGDQNSTHHQGRNVGTVLEVRARDGSAGKESSSMIRDSQPFPAR